MSNENTSGPNGSTTMSESDKKRTEELPDGSPSGDATKDPEQDSDTTSGGEPD